MPRASPRDLLVHDRQSDFLNWRHVQHIAAFDAFLNDTVNLNKSRLDSLNASVEAVYSALSADTDLGPLVKGKKPQGSWAHRTIIKPPGTQEFDADFLLELEEVPEWDTTPSKYLELVAAALAAHGTYTKKPRETKRRCVRLVYQGDFHLDIVPYVKRGGDGYVVYREDEAWERTDPEGYTAWIKDKDSVTNGNLRRVIRILKYIRDSKKTFTGTKSVLLTALVGEQVQQWRTYADPGYYRDVPTTLLHVVRDLDEWLQARATKPSIMDPAGTGVTFDHRWKQPAYDTLRDRMHEYAETIDAAYHCQVKDESVTQWQKVLGNRFTLPASRTTAAPFGPVTATPTRSGRAG